MRVLFSMLIVCIWLSAAAQSGQTEMSKAIGQMQQLYGMNFVYDASLTAVRPKQNPCLTKRWLKSQASVRRNGYPMGNTGQVCSAVASQSVYLFRLHPPRKRRVADQCNRIRCRNPNGNSQQ